MLRRATALLKFRSQVANSPPTNGLSFCNCKHVLTNLEVFQVSRRLRHNWYKYKAWPNNWLPFKWERPEHVPGYFNTGDPVEGLPEYDPNRIHPAFESSEVLKNAPEDVKKLFTLRMFSRREIVKLLVEENRPSFARHAHDKYSPEVKIARLTMIIRASRQVLREQPNNATLKTMVVNCSFRRKRFLKELYRTDKERYELIVKKLNLEHTPSPPGESDQQRIERKKELRRLTAEYCDQIRTEKLNKYHAQLKEEQTKFVKEKEEVEKWITDNLAKYNLEDPRV